MPLKTNTTSEIVKTRKLRTDRLKRKILYSPCFFIFFPTLGSAARVDLVKVRLVALGTGDSTFVIDVESATRKAYSGMPLFLKGVRHRHSVPLKDHEQKRAPNLQSEQK
eukprot:1350671-Amphidinium_carterae.1